MPNMIKKVDKWSVINIILNLNQNKKQLEVIKHTK